MSYDAAGRLANYTAGAMSLDLAWDGTDLLIQKTASGTIGRRYVHGPGLDEPLMMYRQNNGTSDRHWLHADARGSVIAQSGNFVVVPEAKAAYYAFVAVRSCSKLQIDGLALATFFEIYPIVKNFSPVETDINTSTEIYKELGIFGDDLDEMLGELQRKYNIDFSDFPWKKYARVESVNPLIDILEWVGIIKYRSFTVGMLVNVASAGKWIYD